MLEAGAEVSLSSLRIDRISPFLVEALVRSGTKTITLAPEAGSQRMRDVLAMAGRETPAHLGHGEPTFPDLPVEWGDTVHIDVVDRFGNMVAATPSGCWLQGSPAAARSHPAQRGARARRASSRR